MTHDITFSTSEAARRTGLSVSAVRFYADEGLVSVAGRNGAGHRQFDALGVARLEAIRTLRQLGIPVELVATILQGSVTLHEVLRTHLDAIEVQQQELRQRQAIIHALLHTKTDAEQVALVHRLISMSDEDRQQRVDEFWDDVARDLEVPEGFTDRLRSLRPELPQQPTSSQLAAWIELADLLADNEFREAVRGYLHEYYGWEVGRTLASDPMQDFIHGAGSTATAELQALHRDGVAADAENVAALVREMTEELAAAAGMAGGAALRTGLAHAFRALPELLEQVEELDAQDPFTHHRTQGRYSELVERINGTPGSLEPMDGAFAGWLANAFLATA